LRAAGKSVVALTVKFADVPRIPRADRLEVRKLAENFWQITAHFGFVQVPDLPAALRQAKASGCEIELRHAIFFNARDAVVAKRTHNLAARARLLLFAFMLRNAVRAVDLFRIPTDNFIEMGRLVKI
jgi:KUP system potassium uptake protein